MKIVFMGTPDFAVPALEALIKAGHCLAAVVTQPDKPKGRGKAVLMPPVKEKAMEHGIAVYQPERIKRDEAFFEELVRLAPDAIVVAAFGQLLPKRILDLPRLGCVNIHASLLPRYRGSAPIQWAVINGETVTGITTMMMNEGLDTGDMLEKVQLELDPKETGGSLFEKLSAMGGDLIISTLEKLENGTAEPCKQREEDATYARMLDKSLGDIDWSMSAAAIERLIRGLNPWPSAYTRYKGKTMKIWAADVVENHMEKEAAGTEEKAGDDGRGPVPGRIAKVDKDCFLVETGDGLLAVRELQLAGKKRMDTAAFLRGYGIEEGIVLETGP